MAFAILGSPVPSFFDSSGSPLVAGSIRILNPSDDTVKASYPTADDADASTNGTSGDITLDARGEPTSTQLWGRDNEDYKILILDSSAATILTMDDIRMPSPSRRATVTFTSADATPTIAESNNFITAGNTTITNFTNGQVGDVITIVAATTITLTDSATLVMQNNLDMRMVAGDSITFAMSTDQVWHETSRMRNTSHYQDLTGTTTLTEGDSGRTFFLNSGTEFTTTLPAVMIGTEFRFMIKAAPSGADYVVTVTDGAFIGGINELEVDTGDDGPYSTTGTNCNFKDGVAVIGDYIDVISDGVNWYIRGQTNADGGITFS